MKHQTRPNLWSTKLAKPSLPHMKFGLLLGDYSNRKHLFVQGASMGYRLAVVAQTLQLPTSLSSPSMCYRPSAASLLDHMTITFMIKIRTTHPAFKPSFISTWLACTCISSQLEDGSTTPMSGTVGFHRVQTVPRRYEYVRTPIFSSQFC